MTTDKSPSDLHDHLGYWLRTVSNAVSQSFARKVEGEGVTVAERVPHKLPPNPHNERYLATKRNRTGHLL